MQIYPAIDILGGKCVRLRQGDYSQETVFGDDPAAVARRWVADGAKAGYPVNEPTIRAIVEAAGVPCQLGGGIRTDAHVADVLGWGIGRVILGTRALFDPLWFRSVCERHPGKVVLGIDAKHGKVAANGWLELSERSPIELAREAAVWPLAAIAYTDIARDGMLDGPNLGAYAEMISAVTVPVIASGGVTTLDNIRDLTKIGVAGAIIGRALYEGRLDLKEVLACNDSR